MASQNEPNTQSDQHNTTNENKYMWIAVGVIVLVMVGGMGINMLVHKETNAGPAEMSTTQPGTQK